MFSASVHSFGRVIRPQLLPLPLGHRRQLNRYLAACAAVAGDSSPMATNSVRVAAAQMTSISDLAANFATCSRLVKEAASAGAKLICFPEAFSFVGARDGESVKIAEPLDGPIMQKYCCLARECSIWLSLGGFQERGSDDEHLYNTHVVVDDTGKIRSSYRKIHLFDVDVPGGRVYKESSFTEAGKDIVAVDSPIGRLGLTVCYDLRFPELYQLLRFQHEAQVLLVPSAFTKVTGQAHWEILLRARAIETQCYVIAAAQAGKHNDKRESYGDTLIIDPWGTVVGRLPAPHVEYMLHLKRRRKRHTRVYIHKGALVVMALLVRASSAFTATRDPSLPPRRFPSSSETFAVKFSRAYSLKLQLRPQFRSSNVVSNSSVLSPTRPRAMAASVQEDLPLALTSISAPPNLFDGTIRLFIAYTCPYAQRVWITRDCKGLQDKIQLVPIDLHDRPAWYKEKVYPPNKVPALEHNNEVRGESLDLMKYIDTNFDGPSLLPDDSAKREFAEDLLSYAGTFYEIIVSSFKEDVNETKAGTAFDYIETALSKFDGPFFLGQFSLVDIAYAPFVERFQPFLMDVKNHDITAGRPKLAAWIEELNKIDAYKQTCHDPKELVERYKKRFLAHL